MPRGILIFLVASLALILFWVGNVVHLAGLPMRDGLADAINCADFPSSNSGLNEKHTHITPKIIHQVSRDETNSERWRIAQQSGLDLHSDYECKLWTDKTARDFIATEYPWFSDTFNSYSYSTQRADAIHNSCLKYYGEICIDLDHDWSGRSDRPLIYPAWARPTALPGISNDVVGPVPQHLFFSCVPEARGAYNQTSLLPNMTVINSTGHLFLPVLGKQQMNNGPTVATPVRNLVSKPYHRHPWSCSSRYVGDSWHGEDTKLIFWLTPENPLSTLSTDTPCQMGGHWVLHTLLFCIVGGLTGYFFWWTYSRLIVLCWKQLQRRHKSLVHSQSSIKMRTSGFSYLLFQRARLNQDEEVGEADKASYHLQST